MAALITSAGLRVYLSSQVFIRFCARPQIATASIRLCHCSYRDGLCVQRVYSVTLSSRTFYLFICFIPIVPIHLLISVRSWR